MGILDFYARYFNNMLYGLYYDGSAVYPLPFLQKL